MKHLIPIATAALLSACGASVPNGDVATKRAALDRLKERY